MKKLLVTAMVTASSLTYASSGSLTVDISDIQSQLCIYASKASSLGALIDTDAGPHVCVLNAEHDHAVWETDPNSELLNEDQRQMLLSLTDSKRLSNEVGESDLNPAAAEKAFNDKKKARAEKALVVGGQVEGSSESETQEVIESSSTYGYVHENMESIGAEEGIDSQPQDKLDGMWTALENGFNKINDSLKSSSDDIQRVDIPTTEIGNIKVAPLKMPEN